MAHDDEQLADHTDMHSDQHDPNPPAGARTLPELSPTQVGHAAVAVGLCLLAIVQMLRGDASTQQAVAAFVVAWAYGAVTIALGVLRR